MRTVYQVLDDDGAPVDAHLEVDGSEIVFHSRGGAQHTPGQQNSEYATGLRLILARLRAEGLPVDRVWVDSTRTKDLPLEEREVFSEVDRALSPEQAFTELAKRMKGVGRAGDGTKAGGNSTKRIRIKLTGDPSPETVVGAIKVRLSQKNSKSLKRLPVEMLEKVREEHIWSAVQRLVNDKVDHAFAESTDYDLLVDDDVRLPPKAVFGVAATEALGFEVLPEHFSAGLNTPCFRILESCGYQIIPKATKQRVEAAVVPQGMGWVEGGARIAVHIKKERAPGLSRIKKAQFKHLHGRLFCERCGMDPVEHFGFEDGEACIEVHHAKTQVKDMGDGHKTRLEDLQCLCANCHRVTHRQMKIGDQ